MSRRVRTVGIVIGDERVWAKKPSSPVAGLGWREYVGIETYPGRD